MSTQLSREPDAGLRVNTSALALRMAFCDEPRFSPIAKLSARSERDQLSAVRGRVLRPGEAASRFTPDRPSELMDVKHDQCLVNGSDRDANAVSGCTSSLRLPMATGRAHI
jgi:hypothetical protein